jgi:dGTPase
LEVAQVARGIADYLREDPKTRKLAKAAGGLDSRVVEAASLAHDLGHPPFGHVAEHTLNYAMSRRGVDPKNGFEGNAQSFRIVTKLSARYSRF